MKRASDDLDRYGYVFWAKPDGPLPEAWLAEHERSVAYWNTLVRLNNWMAKFAARKGFGLTNQQFRKLGYRIGKHFRLYWCNRDQVLDSFCNARERALRGIARRPRFASARRRPMAFCMRRPGGLTPEQLFNEKAMVHLSPPDDKGRATLCWTLAGHTVQFKTIIHRPTGKDVLIKSLRLIHDRGHRWKLVLNLQMPRQQTQAHGHSTAVFSPTWLLTQSDIRLGSLWLEGSTTPVTLGKMLQGPMAKYSPIDRLVRIKRLQQMADSVIEDIKQELRPHLADLQAKGWRHNPERYRAAGIYAALDLLEECPAKRAVESHMKTWRRYVHEASGLRARFIRHRDWLYWNWAKWLCQRCETIILEELDIKTMMAKDPKYPRLVPRWVASDMREILAYIAYADLYDKIRKQAHKHGVKVIEARAEEIPQTLAQLGRPEGLRKTAAEAMG